ncbi:MAG: hypothetical protein ACI9MR_004481, partial [Myxococcota bacterium]
KPQLLQGPAGDVGDTGPQGIAGPRGDAGDTGPQGIAGPKGDAGDTGSQGMVGPKGDTGLQGMVGDTGDTGPQGMAGAKGDTGDPGDLSAYLKLDAPNSVTSSMLVAGAVSLDKLADTCAAGQVLAPTPAGWTCRDQGHLDVRDFGATGDGATDDTDALQAALDAVGSEGGAVYFPPGDYLISAALLPRSRTLMRGEGSASTIFNTSGDSASGSPNLVEIRERSHVGIRSLRFVNTTFGNSFPQGGFFNGMGCGVVFIGANDSYVRDSYFLDNGGVGMGVASIYISSSRRVVVSGNFTEGGHLGVGEDNWYAKLAGKEHFRSSENVITDNVVLRPNFGGIATEVDPRDKGSIVANNTILEPFAMGFTTAYARGGRITGNYVQFDTSIMHPTALYACVEVRWSSDTVVANNACFDGRRGIAIATRTGDTSNVIITGNVIRDFENEGISWTQLGCQADHAIDHITITDNVIRNTGGDGIRIKATSVGNSQLSCPDETDWGGASDIIIADNIIRQDISSSVDGIFVTNVPRASITGNKINGGFRNGINAATPDSLIAQNTINAVNSHGILVQGSPRTTIRDNIIQRSIDSGFPQGILLPSSSLVDVDILNNRISGPFQYGIAINASVEVRDVRIVGNRSTGHKSGPLHEFLGAGAHIRTTSTGNTGQPSVRHAGAAPTSGTWSAGDIVYLTNPLTAGHIGVICTASGSPGTWAAFGALVP